jgi:hypothetical protein
MLRLRYFFDVHTILLFSAKKLRFSSLLSANFLSLTVKFSRKISIFFSILSRIVHDIVFDVGGEE